MEEIKSAFAPHRDLHVHLSVDDCSWLRALGGVCLNCPSVVWCVVLIFSILLLQKKKKKKCCSCFFFPFSFLCRGWTEKACSSVWERCASPSLIPRAPALLIPFLLLKLSFFFFAHFLCDQLWSGVFWQWMFFRLGRLSFKTESPRATAWERWAQADGPQWLHVSCCDRRFQ